MKFRYICFLLLNLALVLSLRPIAAIADPPISAVKFVILNPDDSTAGVPATVTIEAQKSNNQVDTAYQNDITLVTDGSATGGGLVDIIDGIGTIEINDETAETVTLSLLDTESTGLDISSAQQVIFAAASDTIAPATITDLAASNPATSSIDLAWTAPGDDESTGTAAMYDIRYSTSKINNENKWNSAAQVSGEPVPQIAGSNESMTISGLAAETEYYFAIKTSDEVPNESDISNVASETTVSASDTIAPAAISDLSASSPTASSIDLAWTAPGDDESTGTAAMYDIRYSTSKINNENKWNSAAQVSGEPVPQIAGSNESMTISGLAAETEYYFAIKTSDEVPNESDISNVASETTVTSAGDDPEWNQQLFWFRDDDGDEITATGFGTEDVGQNTNIINVSPGTNFRLRLALKLTKADDSISPQLEFKEGTDCTAGNWTIITPESPVFNLQLSPNFIDADATTQRLVSGPNFIAGQILEITNPAESLSMLKDESTEYEWSLKVSPDTSFAVNYSFRITAGATVLNTYEQCPSLTTQSPPPPPPPPPPSSSSGGSSWIKPRPTTVIFSGKAFPGAKILVIDKPMAYAAKIVSQEIISQTDGSFQISLVDIMQSQHSFGLIVKDKEGRNSQTKFFTIDVLANDLIAKDVVFSPTIDFASRLVTRGKNAVIVGYASPESSVILEIDGIIKKEVKAAKDGFYRIEAATGDLDFGNHWVRTKQIIQGENMESDFSPSNILAVSHLVSPKVDLSGDGKVDVKDWSIFLFQWISEDTAEKKIIDFNKDNKIDISDFSIFVRSIRLWQK